ncbi:hypothetical protein COV81_05295 [Candidatus Peregrinibacteria bacterium CG11_big_fil_rev_8_21_14_0_20_41_10]|nr:MAG: hypothetical protein COV81_05295 [Candidatus Peregrinibacteria bacterium CG11_big_fil_rev_8_21_14_0_20_41_10]PJC38327.1 MAG: hypothetical protein CO045_00975 [Candidatus Peregrinibacteria bacterium CG_4_9_14_0_2_um_filter_41_14]
MERKQYPTPPHLTVLTAALIALASSGGCESDQSPTPEAAEARRAISARVEATLKATADTTEPCPSIPFPTDLEIQEGASGSIKFVDVPAKPDPKFIELATKLCENPTLKALQEQVDILNPDQSQEVLRQMIAEEKKKTPNAINALTEEQALTLLRAEFFPKYTVFITGTPKLSKALIALMANPLSDSHLNAVIDDPTAPRELQSYLLLHMSIIGGVVVNQLTF